MASPSWLYKVSGFQSSEDTGYRLGFWFKSRVEDGVQALNESTMATRPSLEDGV